MARQRCPLLSRHLWHCGRGDCHVQSSVTVRHRLPIALEIFLILEPARWIVLDVGTIPFEFRIVADDPIPIIWLPGERWNAAFADTRRRRRLQRPDELAQRRRQWVA